MADSDDSFVGRWARRKQSARARPAAPRPDRAQDLAAATEGAEPATADAAESNDLVAALPDIDTLTEESDFTVFLQEGVPEALRRKALRRLWRLNPVFANLDGLNDYDEDFTLATSALQGAIKTVYQVGKGMADSEDAEAEAAPPPADAEAPEAADQAPASAAAELAIEPSESLEPAPEPPAVAPALAAGEPVATVPGAPRSSSAAARRWQRFKC